LDLAENHNSTSIFKIFVQEANSQEKLNCDSIINAIPIIAYHNIQDANLRGSTGVASFSEEMKYLHDNNLSNPLSQV